jgi:hypothetical protein
VDAFEKAASKADPREPSVMIRRDTVGEVSSTQESPARGRRPTGSDMQAVGDRPLKRRVNRAR